MSLDAARPLDFLEFAHAQRIQATAADYLPRQVFGEYLRTRLEEARAAQPRVDCQHLRARALQLRRSPGGRFELWLDDGRALQPDRVVLAPGNAPPASLRELDPIADTRFHVRDPWSLGNLNNEGIESVLLIGSGLTMVDAALRLAAIRPRLRRIHVLSRHGLLPQSQATQSRPQIRPDIARLAAHRVRRAGEGGTHWRGRSRRGATGGNYHLCDLTCRRCGAISRAERARFLRHAPTGIHRHRVPAAPLAAVHALMRMGV
jgi:uncharacterized NAD(P)/FAD-binding protein YdhS